MAHRNQFVRRWAHVLVPFLSLHAAAQVFSVLAGLLVIRSLPVGDYAIYTLVTALQGTLTILTDAGVTSLLIARAGPIHTDRARLSELVAAAQRVRRRLETIALLLLIPLLWLWLGKRGLGAVVLTEIAVLLALTLHFQVGASIYSTIPLILLEPGRTQGAQLLGAVSRVVLVYAVVKLMPEVVPALAASALATGAQSALSWYYARSLVNLDAPVSGSDVREIRALVVTQLINTLYYAFSSQLTVWVIGLKGSKPSIAAVGALGRLGSIVALGQTGVAMLIVPRMARYTDFGTFSRRYLQVVGATVFAAVQLVILAVLAPSALLWFLGSKYADLTTELPLAIGSAATFAVSATIFLLNTSKAWIERAWIAVPITIIVQVASLLLLDVSTPRGAILFGWLSLLPPIGVNSTIAFFKLRRWRLHPTD